MALTRDELEAGIAGLTRVNKRGELSDLGLVDAIMYLVDDYAPVSREAQNRHFAELQQIVRDTHVNRRAELARLAAQLDRWVKARP